MKNFLILLVCIMIGATNVCQAKVVKTKSNQWVYVDSTKTKKAKQPDKVVGTYTHKDGKTYKVYQGKRGGLYWLDSNGRKHYLPKNK